MTNKKTNRYRFFLLDDDLFDSFKRLLRLDPSPKYVNRSVIFQRLS